MHAGQEREKTLALDGLGTGEGQRAHAPAVKRVVESQIQRAFGLVAGQLDGRLDRLGSRVGQESPLLAGAGSDIGQLLGYRRLLLIVKVGAAGVDQPLGLLLDGLDHIVMAMTGGHRGDPGDEVQIAVPVGILQIHALAPFHHHGVGSGIGRGDVLFIHLQNGLGLGPGQLGMHAVFFHAQLLLQGMLL